MANFNDRNRSRGGLNQDWENDDYRNPTSDFENERRRYSSSSYGQERGDYSSNFDNDRNRGENDRYRGYRDSYRGEGGGRYQGDSDWGMYGTSGGMNRGSSGYGSREDRDWNYRGTIGPESRGGRYGDDRYRNEDRGWWDRTKDEVSSWFGDDDAERRRHMDEQRSQMHRGKGPKGYTRSDERIKEDVNDRLSDDDYVDASDIDVIVNNCEVTLSGTVKNRAEKRRAEDLVESISGVKNVENRIRVNTESNVGTGNQGAGALGVPYGSSGSNPVGAFDTSKRKN